MTISRADASGTSTGHSLANAPTNGVLTAQFVALLAVNAAFSFSFSTYFLLPKFMAQQLGAGASQIGALATVFGATTLLTIPLVGRLLDGAHNRSVIVAACALMAASALGFVWIDEVGPALYVLRCLQGFALSMFNAAAAVMVTEMAPAGRLAQSLGLFAGSGMAMTAVAPAFVEWLTERTSYRPAFALASVSAVLALGLALRLTVGQHAHAAPSSLRAILRRPSSLRMILVLGSAGLGFGVMFAFSSPYALGLGMKNVRGFFFAFAAAAVCVRLLLGRAIDTIGPARVATASLIGYGLVVASMCALSPGRLEVLGGLFGLTHGLFIPAFNAFILGDAAQHERGKLVTLFHGAFNLGNCAVVLLGMLAERVGYPIVFALTGALMLSSPLLMLGWPRSTS